MKKFRSGFELKVSVELYDENDLLINIGTEVELETDSTVIYADVTEIGDTTLTLASEDFVKVEVRYEAIRRIKIYGED